MGFADETARAMATWFGADMTDAVTYNGVALRGHADFGSDLDHRTGSVMARATLQVKVADVPAPAYRDRVVVNGQTFHVQPAWTGDGLTWTLELGRDERPVWKP